MTNHFEPDGKGKYILLSFFPLALPLGQLPILKIDGEVFCQSNALTGYAAKLAGLPELTAVEELRSCMVIETINEAFEGLVTTAFPAAMAVPDPGKFNDCSIFAK